MLSARSTSLGAASPAFAQAEVEEAVAETASPDLSCVLIGHVAASSHSVQTTFHR